jgi:hypothetical protein
MPRLYDRKKAVLVAIVGVRISTSALGLVPTIGRDSSPTDKVWYKS